MYLTSNDSYISLDNEYSANLGSNHGDVNGGIITRLMDAIAGQEQAMVTAAVDPILTIILSATTCSLGALSTSAVNGCEVDVTITTNGASGYVVYVRDANNGVLQSTGDTIAVVVGSPISAGTEAFDISTSKAGQTVTQTTNCNTVPSMNMAAATALSTSNKAVASAATPIESDVTTTCLSASIGGQRQLGRTPMS